MKNFTFYFCLVSFLFLSCSRNTADVDRHNEAINQIYSQFNEAYLTLNDDLVGNLYADQSHYLVPSEERGVLQGQSTIKNEFTRYFGWAVENGRNLSINFRIVHREIDDSLAYDVGYYLIQSKADSVDNFPEGGSVGKFVTVIGMQPDGEWKFLLDGYNQAPYDAFWEADSIGFDPVNL